MRVRLDDRKSYDIAAMFIPRFVGYQQAYQALRANYSSWKHAASLPLRVKNSWRGFLLWLLVLPLHSLSLLLLIPLLALGASMKAYAFFLSNEKQKMNAYQEELKRIYAAHQHIRDPDEYARVVKEEIEKIKPFKP